MAVDQEFGDIYFVPSASFQGPLSPFRSTLAPTWLHSRRPQGQLCALWGSVGSLWEALGSTLCTLGFTWLPLGCPWITLGHLGLLRGIIEYFPEKHCFSIPSDWAISPRPAHKNDLTEFIPGDSRKSPGIPEKSPGDPQGSHSAATADFGPPSYMRQGQK